jgi:hypothetical protein
MTQDELEACQEIRKVLGSEWEASQQMLRLSLGLVINGATRAKRVELALGALGIEAKSDPEVDYDEVERKLTIRFGPLKKGE